MHHGRRCCRAPRTLPITPAIPRPARTSTTPQPQPTATATATATAHGRTGSLLPQRGTRTSASATGPWIKEHLPAAAASPLVCTDPRRRSRSAFKDYVIVLNGARPQTYACSCLGITSRAATRPCTHRSSTVTHARTHSGTHASSRKHKYERPREASGAPDHPLSPHAPPRSQPPLHRSHLLPSSGLLAPRASLSPVPK